MSRDESLSGRDAHPDRVDGLDPELLHCVECYVAARSLHQATDAQAEDVWNRFYRACAPLLRRLAHRRWGRCWSEEDRVQELWRILLERLPDYDPGRRSFSSWLATVVRHALSDQERAFHARNHLDDVVERQLVGREAEPMAICEQAEARMIVESAVEELHSRIPEVTYRIIHAHAVEGKSYQEIATALGLTDKQVRDRHYRAVANLRAILMRRIDGSVDPRPGRRGAGKQ